MAAPTGQAAMTVSRVRVFVAVNLPDAVKAEMGKLIASIDALEVRGVRIVRAEGLHLTLRFLGDVDSDDVPSIISAMEYRRRQIRTVRSDAGGGRSVPKRCRTTHTVGGSGR